MKKCPLVLTILCSTYAFNQTLNLQNWDITNNGYNPDGIYYSDLDLDGDPDIVIATRLDNSIGWYENYGARKFSARRIISTAAAQATSVYTADLDDDGDPDILSSSRVDNEIAWYPNLGHGNFGAQIIISTQAMYAYSVHAADLDADGDIDVISASYDDDKIAWYPNLGNGTFGSQIILTNSADRAVDVNTADLDNDGDLDIVFSGIGSPQVGWFPNSGNGNFGPMQQILTSTDGYNVCIADLNMDGNTDIISTRNGGTQLRYHRNSGGGSFSPVSLIPGTLTSAAKGALAKDFDQDGDLDIIGGTNLNAFLIENLGNMTFASPVLLAAVNSYELHAVDLDQDGLLDFISSGGSLTHASIFFNDGNLSFQHKLLSGYTYRATAINASDLDCDGDLDVLTTSSDDNKIGWYENVGDGQITCQTILTELVMQPSLIETFDVDNDGDQDIITGSHSFDNLVLVKNLGSYQFGTPQVITSLVNGPKKVTGADLNNDGWIDLISTSESDDKIAYYLNSGGTGFGPQHVLSTSISDPDGVTATDLDDDGDVDIAVTGSSSWYNTGWFRNLGGGTFSPIIYFQTVISPCGGSNIFAEDTDQDGDPDIVSPGDQISFFPNLGNSTFGPQQLLQQSYGYSEGMVMTDMNMDGYKDIVSLGTNGIKCLNLGQNASTLGNQNIAIPLQTVTSLVAKDLDNDGDGDLLLSELIPNATRWLENHWYESSKAQGRVFVDANQNGVFDSGETVVSGCPISANNTPTKTTTDESGKYTLDVNGTSGYGTIAPELNSNWTITSDSLVYHIQLNNLIHHYTDLDFGIFPAAAHDSVTLSLRSAPTSCGQSGTNWIHLKSNGTTILSGVVKLELDSAISFVQSFPAPDSIVNQTLYWNFTNLGLFRDTVIPFITQTAAFPGTVLSSSVSVLVNNVPIAEYELDWIVNCSLGTSAKTANPPGTQGLINDSVHFIDYTVHFKNESPEIVNTVTIEDKLSPTLKWKSVTLVGSSLPFILNVKPNGNIQFVAENCNLVQSSVNDLQSTGFITFRVWLKDSLSQGTRIKNKARIYYDCTSENTNQIAHQFFNCGNVSGAFPGIGSYCEENSVSLGLPSSFSPFDVEWQVMNETPQTGLQFEWVADTSGQIPLTLTVSNAVCNLDSTFVLNIHETPPVVTLPPITTCEGENITILGISTSIPGVYSETYQNIHGCDSIVEQQLLNYPQTAVTITNFTADSLCYDNIPVPLPNASPAGGVYSGHGISGNTFDPSVAGVGNHFITYTFIDDNNCENSDSASIFVDECLGLNANNINDACLFPNPFRQTAQLVISVEINGPYDVTIYDDLGRKIVESKKQQSSEYIIRKSDLGVGTFLVVVRQSDTQQLFFSTKINAID